MNRIFINAIFIERINRFIVHVAINGEVHEAHLPNTGRCKELLVKGIPVILKESYNKNRKTRYTLHYVENNGMYVNLISVTANEALYNSLIADQIKEITKPYNIKKEVTYGNSRIDIFCQSEGQDIYIEVKGVTLIKDNCLQFPDAPTKRGTKHLEELIKIKNNGSRAIVFFIAQHNGADKFKINKEADPIFHQTLIKALSYGVEAYVYKTIDEIGSYELTHCIKMIEE